MPDTGTVMVEAVVVGLAFLVLFGSVHHADMWLRPGIKNDIVLGQPAEHPSPAMRHSGMYAQAFIAGVLGHVAFEISGINRMYARNYT